MADFINFDRARARAYLAEFINEMEPCLDRLRSRSESTGGPSAAELDLSPASLDPLWDWARTGFAWREGYEPPAHTGLPGPRIEAIEPLEELPSWFQDPGLHSDARFSFDTVWLIDGLGRYLGETAVRHLDGFSWRVGHSRVKHYQFENQPVIAGPPDEVQPFNLMSGAANWVLNPARPVEAPTLAETFERWRAVAG